MASMGANRSGRQGSSSAGREDNRDNGVEQGTNVDNSPSITTRISQALTALLPSIAAQVTAAITAAIGTNQTSNIRTQGEEHQGEQSGYTQADTGGAQSNTIITRKVTYRDFFNYRTVEYDDNGKMIIYYKEREKMESVITTSQGIPERQVVDEAGPSRKRKGNFKDKRQNKRKAFAKTEKKEYTGPHPQCSRCRFHHPTNASCRMCYNCREIGHMAKDCKLSRAPINAVPLNVRQPQGSRGACYKCGGTDHYQNTCPQTR